ncbi:DNA adenine methylase [Enterococcus raffinosus]|uniref:DNA adenine methylase n=1 Tax=Enterococcus raffinosus TaxID=71452 RepID=UPI001C1283C6|nr:DNA adenine methylase [Enterococcus raffinosus]MBU5363447.1 DNA adenine methylase [Enterococcus raffinosus]
MNKSYNNYSILRYPGGKNKVYNYVKHLISETGSSTYIEPFCGGAAIAFKLLIKGDVKKIIINDFDKSIYALWYSVLNHPEELCTLISNAQFNMDEWYLQKDIQRNKNDSDLLSLGFSTLYLNRTNRSGIINAGVIGGKNQTGSYLMDCRFNKDDLIEKIKLISSKRSSIKLYNKDALHFIRQNISRTSDSLTFFDPPYYIKGKALYTNFYEHIDHVELSNTIKNTLNNKNWILTYDFTPEIKEMYKEYEHFVYHLNYSLANTGKGKEYIFLSNSISSRNIGSYLNLSMPDTISVLP